MKNFVLASDTLSNAAKDSLISLGYTPLLLPKYNRLQEGVSSHADMLIFFLGRQYLCSKEYYSQARCVFEQIDELGYSPLFTEEIHGSVYPSDVLFNALLLGNRIYGLSSALSKKLTALANERKIEIVNVRQGYTKCSVCKVSENAIITADEGIPPPASTTADRILEMLPDAFDRIESMIKSKSEAKTAEVDENADITVE